MRFFLEYEGEGDAKRTQQLCRFLFPRSASVEFFISSINFMFNHHLFLKDFLVFFYAHQDIKHSQDGISYSQFHEYIFGNIIFLYLNIEQ